MDALAVGITKRKVNWVLDADLADFFTNLDRGWLMKFLEHRIADKRVLRIIQKWLRAGIVEDGDWAECDAGTPQGATASPLLANVYLHYVFDLWAERWGPGWSGSERERTIDMKTPTRWPPVAVLGVLGLLWLGLAGPAKGVRRPSQRDQPSPTGR